MAYVNLKATNEYLTTVLYGKIAMSEGNLAKNFGHTNTDM